MQQNFSLQSLLLFISIILFFIRYLYWKITEIQANRAKPKQKNFHRLQKMTLTGTMMIVLFFQVIGVEILPFIPNTFVILAGFALVVLGFLFSMLGRYTIGTNWTHALEYQIKKKHELVTKGIYHVIRHPIYSGFFLSILGFEVLLGSYLSIIFLLVAIPILNRQAGKEEKILTEHFGKTYTNYMKRTRRFIPYMW